jgi:large subunit ribosomal protein L14
MLIFVNNNSKVWVSDNTGVSKIRAINFYQKRKARVCDLFIGSISRVKPRRKLKKGQLFRAILVQSRFPVFRPFGSYIRSLATRSILIKRGEYMPISNRVNGFFFYEVKLIKEYKFNSLTVYII